MAHTKKLKSAARFGSRYGKRIRENILAIESQYRNIKVKCPFCNYEAVERVAYGIWYCRKCGKKFASKAYSVW